MNASILIAKADQLLKGDYVGHPFRGNQWTGGASLDKTPDKFRLKNPIKGKDGTSIIGYRWISKLGEKWNSRKQELVAGRVSNWDASSQSTGTGRNIVHEFYVKHKDGSVTVEGIRSAENILGIRESRLKTMAKNEQAAQLHRARQEARERQNAINSIPIRAKETRAEASREYRLTNANSPLRTDAENEAIFDASTLMTKDGKYIRSGSADFLKVLEEEGWKREEAKQ